MLVIKLVLVLTVVGSVTIVTDVERYDDNFGVDPAVVMAAAVVVGSFDGVGNVLNIF